MPVASFTFLICDSLCITPLLVSENPASVGKLHPSQKNRVMVKQKGAKCGGKYAPVSAAAQERVCKSVIRNGKRPKGMGGPPEKAIWMPKYLAPALHGAVCNCFRGRASCGLWFRESTQIVSGPFLWACKAVFCPVKRNLPSLV